jgi:DUF971 family protein
MSPTTGSVPAPVEIKLKKASRQLEVVFADGLAGSMTAEYLRVHSPSAEVQGHGAGQRRLVVGKQSVGIAAIEPVGRYAVRLIFDDGHDTGLFTWPILYELCRNRDENWRRYIERLEAAGHTRSEDGEQRG